MFDEPLYPNYLHHNPDIYRPYREQLLASSCIDADVIMEQLNSKDDVVNIKFVKHMAKFAPNINKKHLFADHIYHVFLIRDPLKQISSWNAKAAVHEESYDLDSSGYLTLYKLYSEIKRESKSSSGKVHQPIVLDSDNLIRSPEQSLKSLCDLLQIPFYPEQLTWPAGPKPDIDGYGIYV